MKKMYAYTKMFMAMMAVMLAFTSCDEDAALAYDLEGVWQGSIVGEYYSYRGYATDDEYDTEIMFEQNGSWMNGGSGYEIDYNYHTRRYTKAYFTWSVKRGRIHMHYDDGTHVVIRDFETYWFHNRMRFKGYFDDAKTGRPLASFNLVKVDSPDDYYETYYSRQAKDFNEEE